jgi:hypothetical protein
LALSTRAGSGWPLNMSVTPSSRSSAGISADTSSPSTTAMRGARPIVGRQRLQRGCATLRVDAAGVGHDRMPRFMTSGSTCFIALSTKSVA